MAMNTPPSSQFRPTVDRVIESMLDLPTRWTRMTDDLIDILAEKNQTKQFRSNESREGIWSLIFDGGWNTSRRYMKPAPMAKRLAIHTQVQIGVLRLDCSESPVNANKRRKKNDGSAAAPPPPPAERRAGAAVFLKVSIKDDLFFMWTDSRGRVLDRSLVLFDEGKSIVDALSMAVDHWDTYETARVRSWNWSMVVFWARERLMNSLERGAIDNGEDVVGLDDLVQLVLASDLLKTLAEAHAATLELSKHRAERTDGLLW